MTPRYWALHTDLPLDAVNVHVAALEDAGLLGLSEADDATTIWLSQRADDLPIAGRWEAVEEQDWSQTWKAGLTPVTVGQITITPPWIKRPDDGTDQGLWIVIQPAQAFGTGHHETTASVLAALQDLDLAGADVLDLGTGSGVLAIAATLRGAARVVAIDTDPLAVEAAADNAQRNGVNLDLRLGSAAAAGGERYDVVLANLDTATLTLLADELGDLLRPSGVLIGAGVSYEREEEAIELLTAAGLVVSAQPGNEWVRLTCRPA